jgi:hypothetical protein
MHQSGHAPLRSHDASCTHMDRDACSYACVSVHACACRGRRERGSTAYIRAATRQCARMMPHARTRPRTCHTHMPNAHAHAHVSHTHTTRLRGALARAGRVDHDLDHLHPVVAKRRVACQRRRGQGVARGPGRLQEEGWPPSAQEPGHDLNGQWPKQRRQSAHNNQTTGWVTLAQSECAHSGRHTCRSPVLPSGSTGAPVVTGLTRPVAPLLMRQASYTCSLAPVLWAPL